MPAAATRVPPGIIENAMAVAQHKMYIGNSTKYMYLRYGIGYSFTGTCTELLTTVRTTQAGERFDPRIPTARDHCWRVATGLWAARPLHDAVALGGTDAGMS